MSSNSRRTRDKVRPTMGAREQGQHANSLRRALERLRRGDTEAPPEAGEDPMTGSSPADRAIVEKALPFTMTGPARLQALVDAVRYSVDRGLAGSFVECGVWRGGSILAMILTLQELGRDDIDIHLFDTFEGMTAPTEHDVSEHDPPALEVWDQAQRDGQRAWSELFDDDQFNEEAVRRTVLSSGYPEGRVHLVKGPVEQTLPDNAPEGVALLRLDTDWYESTRHELEHLYPKLVQGGVLIIDDYGHWDGARRAVDEHLAQLGTPLLLNRIDYTARIAIKA
jgi:O-methyltransferase